MNNYKLTLNFSIVLLVIVLVNYSCQKDLRTNENIEYNVSNEEDYLSSKYNTQLSEVNLMDQIDADFDFSAYGLTPNYDFSRIIKIEDIDERHIYIPLMNSSNDMVDMFLGIISGGKLEYLYFSNSNDNNIKHGTYNYFYNSICANIIPNQEVKVYKIVKVENRGDGFLCIGSYSWWENNVIIGFNDDGGVCMTTETIEHVASYVYPCGDHGFDSGGEGFVPLAGGGSSSGDVTPRPDEDFDDCLELIGIATLQDLQAAEEYHKKCGCSAVLRLITTTELEDMNEFNHGLNSWLESCKTDICKLDTWGLLKSKFNEIIIPCQEEQIEFEQLYESAMMSLGLCNPSIQDLWDEINRISGGNYLIRSDYGYTQNTTVSPELESQLGYLNSGDCKNSIGEVVNNLDEDQICELIALNPDNLTPTQAGTQQCSLESICLMTDILVNGEAAIPMEYPEGFFDCISTTENIGDEAIRMIFDNDPNSILAKENYLSDVEEVNEIDNGIIINGYSLWGSPTNPTPGFFIGQNTARDFDGDPDLSYGTDGDIEIMKERYRFLAEKPIPTLLGHMTNLLDIFGANDIGRSLIATFTQNQNVEQYYSEDLSKKVFNHVSVNNFVKTFGKELEREIMEHDGVLFDMDFIQLSEADRPKFNTTTDNLNGLRILINDTEHTIVNVNELSVDLESGDWSADLYLRIKDNFGLDDADMEKFQDVNLGFTSWWILQHVKGFVPFISSIKIKVNVSGNFND